MAFSKCSAWTYGLNKLSAGIVAIAGLSNKIECLTLNHIWLAENPVQVPAAAHEVEASFASDCSQKAISSKIDVVTWY